MSLEKVNSNSAIDCLVYPTDTQNTDSWPFHGDRLLSSLSPPRHPWVAIAFHIRLTRDEVTSDFCTSMTVSQRIINCCTMYSVSIGCGKRLRPTGVAEG